jgi:hypothetical protein
MRSLIHTALLLALAAPAVAQEPTEEQKHDALLKAYHINSDSMVGWGSIDMTTPPVKTEPIIPDAKAEQSNEIDAAAAAAQETRRRSVHRALREVRRRLVDSDDVCTIHHMHKIVTHGGKSWRCKK